MEHYVLNKDTRLLAVLQVFSDVVQMDDYARGYVV